MNLDLIPPTRLALLDTAILFHGSHRPIPGEPDCQHCARELAYEIATGTHADKTPPGCTMLFAILPNLNDGYWHNDEHRTQTLRPYLRKMLSLNPTLDAQRIYAVIDYVYRKVTPDICDALKLASFGPALRNLAPIVDKQSTLAALDTLTALAALNTLTALASLDTLDTLDTLATLDTLTALATLNTLNALASLASRASRAAAADHAALNTLTALASLASRAAVAAVADHAARAESWAIVCRELLDLVCSIN